MNNRNIEEIVKNVVNAIKSTNLTLSEARYIVRKVEEEAEKIGVKAVVAVADCGANVICVECMDDAYIASYDIAVNKAFTSVSLKMATKTLKPLAQPGGELYGIQNTNGGKIVIFGGGVPLIKGGKVVGGVGVSGGSEKQDTYLGDYAQKVFEELK
ncbi:MAG: heme-binding protein [Ruminococcaceae bacterium]|nr:heme-binding protein [Oscillospiraceae bacterium]